MNVTSCRKLSRIVCGIVAAMLLAGCVRGGPDSTTPTNGQGEPSASAVDGRPTPAASASAAPQVQESKTRAQLVEQYGALGLTDVHNHDASNSAYRTRMSVWDKNAVGRVVLFGDVSEPSAIRTDGVAWAAYRDSPDVVIPFFSGIDLRVPSSLDVARSRLEQGYFGIGEVVAASTHSPVVSQVAWKANDPMDGNLPRLYELCAQYKAPILLHIDPLSGEPIAKLKEALDTYPDTTFILGHINAYNSPDNVEKLLEAHPNLYADFFAGFTDLNPDSAYSLEDFIPVMKKFPDRFLLSTDSGYGLPSEEAAIESMYRTLDLLGDDDLRRRIAHDNFDAILQAQPATKTQLEALDKLGISEGEKPDLARLTKLEAGRLLVEAGVDMTA